MSKTPFLHLLPPRLAKTAQRLSERIWTVDDTPLDIYATPPTSVHYSHAERGGDFLPVTDFPHYWGRSFDQRWFRIDLGDGGLKGFTHLAWRDRGEATVYLDGVPVGGVDPGHPFVALSEGFRELHIESICCRTGIWVHNETQGIDDRGSRLEGAFLARRDEVAWTAYYDYLVLWELCVWLAGQDRDLERPDLFSSPMRVRENWFTIDPLVRILVDGLDRAVDVYDREGPAALSEALRPLYRRVRGGLGDLRATVTGHAHIDLVWLWPERIGEAKAVHTFANVESLMRRYPEFIFGYSQPASYRAVGRRSPELMERVGARVAEGRWEPVGALEVECDTHLPCGEALARNLLLGQAEFQRMTGSPSRVVWLPDVFGYSACLPRLMAEAGVEFFYTTKLAWSTYERFPYTSFRWRGHDGTEITSHVMGYDQDYNSHGTIAHLCNPMRAHRQVHVHPEVLIPTGYGDGGGGPTEEMCERIRRSADLAGVPATGWGRIDQFFERLRESESELPVWDGEIFLEFHRGVFTTHVAVKQVFRALERGLQTLEAAHCATGRGVIDPHFWRRLVFSQFHDDIPGSSIIEVYEEGLAERGALIERALGEAAECFGKDGEAACFNPLPLPVKHRTANGLLEIGPLGVEKQTSAREASPEESCHAEEGAFYNNRCRLTWDRAGRISGLSFDGREVPLCGATGILRVYPDHPALFEAWDIDRNSVGAPLPCAGEARFIGVEESALRCVVRFHQPLTERSTAEFSYEIEAGSPVVRIEIVVDWADDEKLLRWEAATGYRTAPARYGAPFGSVTRPQKPGRLSTEAVFEVPGSRWMVVGDEGETNAVALTTKDRYGFGCHDGVAHCTLLRSALITETRTNRPLRSPAYDHTHSDHGRHHFSLALASGRLDAPCDEQPAALADTLFTDFLPVRTEGCSSFPLPQWSGGATVVPSWMKPAEDGQGWILRMHETRGQRGSLRLEDSRSWKIERVDLREQSGKNWNPGEELSFTPCDLISLRLRPRPTGA